MDTERARIQDDLRGLIEGDVLCDDLFVQIYASDASIYEIRPLGVVRPRSVADVAACAQYAAENNLPIHARGAGTGSAGQSLGPGLVLDFSCYMRRTLEIREDTVRLQPGVVLAHLNRQLEPFGRLFGPDPASRAVTTMGSVIALDASGSHWPQYGSARDHIERLQVVLADGQVIEAGRVACPAADGEPQDRRGQLTADLAALLDRENRLLEAHRPATCVHRAGYQLHEVRENGHINLAKLLAGSEGTLGLFTEMTVRTSPRPAHRGVVLFFFDRLDRAAQAALLIAAQGASACDLMDRRLLTIAREIDRRFEEIIPRDAEAMLLVERHGDDAQSVRDALQQLVQQVQRQRHLAFASRMTLETQQRNLFWRLTRRVVPTLYRLKGSTRALPFVEDVVIPRDTLPEVLVQVQNILKRHEVTATVFAHAGHGQLHLRPFLDLSDPEDVRKMQRLASDLYEHILRIGGTLGGEHGSGLSRSWFAQRMHGPLYPVYREVKRIFDPQNIFNPGKLAADAAQPLTANLRPVKAAVAEMADEAMAPGSGPSTIPLLLRWDDETMAQAARTCNGCGRCRTLAPDDRMCPIFRFSPREETSPRSKANLVRAVITGQLDPTYLTQDTLKRIADLCIHCHQCRLECPAEVDIPKLMAEVKGQYVATNGLRPADAFLVRLERWAAWGANFHRLVNWSLGNRQMRWLLEKTVGIAQGRKLPRLAPRPFLRVAHRRRLTRPGRHGGRKIAFFVDVYANWFDVQLAEAFVAVMQHNGIAVYVPPRQCPSGITAVSLGAVERARQLARDNVDLLAEAVRQGYQVVTTEPSAALCLRREYPQLLDGADVDLVARNTFEACHYLWQLHESGNLELDLKPINATLGYHQPCHSRAINGQRAAGEQLLRLIPGLTVRRIERGCSGMAGTFGLKQASYRSSLRAGWPLISALRRPGLQAGATECSACKMQMEQGTTKPTVHPLKMLALSYGLMPELEASLTARGRDLIVT